MEIEYKEQNKEGIPILGINEVVISPGIESISSYKRLSFAGTMFSFACSTIGTSVVATPYAFSLSTPIVGIFYEIFFGAICWLSAVVLFEVSRDSRCTSFIDLGRKAYSGKKYEAYIVFCLVTLPLLLLLLSATISYVFIASDVIYSQFSFAPKVAIQAIVSAFLAALSIQKSFNKLRFLSIITTGLFVVSSVLILAAVFDLMPYVGSIPSTLSARNMIRAIPILFVGLNGHAAIPGITFEMKPTVAPKFYMIAAATIGVIVLFNCVVGYFPAVIFGNSTLDDIVNQLFQSASYIYLSTPAIIIAIQIILAIVIIAKTPIVIFPIKEIILDNGKVPLQQQSYLAHSVASFFIMLTCFCLGLIFNDLNQILSVIGGLGSIMLVTLTPGLLHFQLHSFKFLDSRGTTLLACAVALLSFNFAAIILTYV